MAADHAQDSDTPDSMADIPALRQANEPPLRRTNRDLRKAMKYLFDLSIAGQEYRPSGVIVFA